MNQPIDDDEHEVIIALYEALKGLLENSPTPKGIRRDYSYILYREAARTAIAKAEKKGVQSCAGNRGVNAIKPAKVLRPFAPSGPVRKRGVRV